MEVLDRLLHEVARSYTVVVVGIALVVLPLLRAFGHDKRRSKTLVGLLMTHVLLVLVAFAGSGEKWATYVRLLAAILAATAAVLMVGALLFSVLLPRLRVHPPRILQDLLIVGAVLIVVFPVASLNGVDLSGLIATSAVLTAVVGFALQDTLGNFFSGLALQLDDSIRPGDWIKVGQLTGKVTSVRWRYVAIETRDWQTLVIPNSILTKENVLILGKRKGQPVQLRQWVYFNVDYRYQPQTIIEIVANALRSADIPNVSSSPPPDCIVMEFSDSFCRYAVRFWLTDLAADDPTKSLVRTRVFLALKRQGISLSIPAHAVFMTEESSRRKEEKSAEDDERRAELLRSLPIFGPLSEEELLFLAHEATYTPFARGEIMTRQGADPDGLYVIIRGNASVNVAAEDGRTTLVSRLGPRDFFGEMGLMTGEARAATVVAESDTECYRLGSRAFEQIVSARPQVAEQMAEVLAQRKVELSAALDHLEATMNTSMRQEKEALVDKIRSFFGLR